MSGPYLAGERVLILGAETEIGRAVTTAVAEAGASVAAVAATSDADAAFAVQRLARRLSSGERKVIAQAIDATNEAAVRVMVRQVTKELGGLSAVVFCQRPLPSVVSPQHLEENLSRQGRAYSFVSHFANKEFERGGGGKFIVVAPGVAARPLYIKPIPPLKQPLPFALITIGMESKDTSALSTEVVAAIADTPSSR